MTNSAVLATRINIREETPYVLSELGRHLPAQKSESTIKHWVYVGMKHALYPGQRVKLEVIKINGVKHSTKEAYYRLIEDVNTPEERE